MSGGLGLDGHCASASYAQSAAPYNSETPPAWGWWRPVILDETGIVWLGQVALHTAEGSDHGSLPRSW